MGRSLKPAPAAPRRVLTAAHENHDEERNASNADTRKAIPGGNWTCGGAACAPNTTVASTMTTAQYVTLLEETAT